MNQRIIDDYLEDIVTSVNEIGEFIEGMDYQDFKKDKKTVYAVIRSFEVIGEASRMVPDSFRKMHPTVPWKKMVGMRDTLIHDYRGIDLEIVWNTAKGDIPNLKKLLGDIK